MAMNSKLRTNELCPIHRSRFCCGREGSERDLRNRKGVLVLAPGIRRIEDRHAPKGYRELCSPAEMRRRKIELVKKQNGICAICNVMFQTWDEVETDHIEPKGLGGARRDDSWDNIRATHKNCNREKGSKRI